ncbi:MAG: hypothetical protein JW990_19420 [Thermoleophilia bacterium]|nr:hypothetical protein [Thermoleophilia bacterium]
MRRASLALLTTASVLVLSLAHAPCAAAQDQEGYWKLAETRLDSEDYAQEFPGAGSPITWLDEDKKLFWSFTTNYRVAVSGTSLEMHHDTVDCYFTEELPYPTRPNHYAKKFEWTPFPEKIIPGETYEITVRAYNSDDGGTLAINAKVANFSLQQLLGDVTGASGAGSAVSLTAPSLAKGEQAAGKETVKTLEISLGRPSGDPPGQGVFRARVSSGAVPGAWGEILYIYEWVDTSSDSQPPPVDLGTTETTIAAVGPVDDADGHDDGPTGKVPGPQRWWEWLAGTLVPGLVAGGLSLAGGLFGGGGLPSPPRSGLPGGAPSPPRTLQGQDALDWLKRRGLVAQTTDGRWVKTGDWNSATAPGGGMRGYVEATQSTPGAVDAGIAILVESDALPASPAGPGFNGVGLVRPADPGIAREGPSTHGIHGGAVSVSDNVPDRTDGLPAEGVESPGRPPTEPGGAELAPEPGSPKSSAGGGRLSTEPGVGREPHEGASEEGAEPASDELAPQFAPGTRRAVDDANEALTEIKDSWEQITGPIGGAVDALNEVVSIADKLGLADQHKAAVERAVDRIRKPLEELQEKFEDKLEPLTEGIDSAQESWEAMKNGLERTDRVSKAYKETYENLPDYLAEGSKVAISSYAAAFQAAGEIVDHQIRSIPGIGPQIADALQKGGISPVDVGTESGKALLTAVKNVTAHEARVQDAVDPILQKLADGHTRVEDLPQDEQDLLAMSGRDPYKLRDQRVKSEEMEWAIERGDMEYIKRNDPELYEKMEKARKESFHPPPGTYEQPSALKRTLFRVLELFI